MKLKKITSIILACTMTAALFAGCGKKEAKEPESAKANETTLSLWTVFTGSDGDVLKEIINKYNETNEDGITVEVDIMDNDTLQSKLPAAISTDTAPSFILVGIEYIQEYVNNDSLEDISDFWKATNTNEDNYYENVVAKSYVGDTLYGVPMQYNLQYLYYNKDMFSDAGLNPDAPPTTFDELEECAKALTDKDQGKYGLAMPTDFGYYVQYLWGNGGDVINTATDENLLNSETNIKTLTWLQELKKAGVSPDGLTSAEADTMFQSGQIGMCLAGPWNINILNGLGMNYGIAAMPSGSDGAYSAEGGCSYMIPKGTDEATKNAVYKFMAYWLTDDVLKEWSVRNGFPVWSYSLLEDEEIKSNDILNSVSEASSIGRDWHLGYEYGTQIDNDVMKPMMENILMGSDVTGEVKDASNRLDEIVTK
ncbi:MAG: ABC transporter substrate-binding protein [Faecalicatena sp.]|uniref:ABC transporter substrate-binding protein n=1 Tax=Faecalicatena sp. TaxID=2005360 RepID=UPI00258F6A32|nr:ABC transporter substrate-binding protein [Faecalicatena sp.]MCI6464710.1 ABC transporter substrate-binding protein [Faecalicatena sp.]MDY5618288.1 ABC transporter substrate-binding protein [Lachnospiraceae bacterium]